MDEPRAKRPKIARGEDDNVPGNIIAIELHNFMTFDYLKCKPCPRLNLVIGPNGSGKSSLVCAIALGLGGEPQLLGRATSVGAYVKRGEESGYVKISLRGDTEEESIVITRKINSSNKSEWLFNGKVVPKKDVTEVIQRFNIQVNNLTQFLPQDRVCEFAKLTPVQLLEETEKAVGDPQLTIQHRMLVQKSHHLKNIQRTVERNGETLNQLKALNAEQEKDVERIRQREELLAKVEVMKKKMPWLKYDMVKAKYMEAKRQEKDANKKLSDAAKTLNDHKEPIEKQKKEKAALDAIRKRCINLMGDNAKRRMEILEMGNQLEVQVLGKHKEIEDQRRQKASREQRIVTAREDLAAAEFELQNLPAIESNQGELARLGAAILERQQSANQMRRQKTEKERNLFQLRGTLRDNMERLKDLESTKHKLLHALRSSGTEKIYEAYKWVQDNRSAFQKEVFGPILLEVKVSNRQHANYLEIQVPYYVWKSFITQDPSDRDLLVKNLRPFDVPILNYVGFEALQGRPFHISNELQKLGIYSRLDQVFDAPEAVKEVMISQCGLQHSYIGSKETDLKADKVSEMGVSDFWTPENHYRWTKSRYGGHVSGSVEPVAQSRLLLCSSDAGEMEKLRGRIRMQEDNVNALEECLRSLQSDIRILENEESKLQKEREEIFNAVNREKKKKAELDNLVVQRRRKLESLEKEEDSDIMMAELNKQVAELNGQRYEHALHLKKLLAEAVSYKRIFAQKHMESIEFDSKIKELEISLKEHEKFALQASLHLEDCKKEVENCRKRLSDAKQHAESVAVITPALENAFLELPTTIEELEAAIQDNICQANSILFLNPNILAEYEDRRHQIEGIAEKLDADKDELRRCLSEIDSLKAKWLPTLRNLVSQINETFSRNFQEMAVAGEVSLDEHNSDFDQYGILIKVKFRQAGQLQVLSAHHQSGGERSVSTILYLVSLQDLTNCPFRVVDEINQGMDPINERKMFQQLVRAASQPNTPQCFLLTPKLLPDLEYSEACSILSIMNGPWIEQPSKVWRNGECWRTVAGLVGGR